MSEKKRENEKYKSLQGVFLKTSKKRLITSVIISVILFTLLSTFLLTWFNYRYKSFQNHESTYEWYNDNQISIIYSSIFDLKDNPNSFLDLAINEIHSTLDTLASKIFDNYTTSMYYEMESLNYPLNQTYDASLLTLQQEVYNVLANSLIDGRLPNNESELLYYSNDLTSPVYQLGDKLGLQITRDEISYVNNFTIVGIIDSFSYNLYQNGFSNDIFQHFRIDQQEFDQYKIDLFFINSHDFSDIMLNYPFSTTGGLTLNVDFNYEFDIKELNNLLSLTNELDIIQSNQDFEYLPKTTSFCYDFDYFVISFQANWISQTFNIFVLGVPIFLLFSLLIRELFNIGNFEKSNQFKLFKTYGLEFGTLRKIVFTENLITTSIGAVIGIILGTLIGFLISSFGLDIISKESYFNAHLEPAFYITIITLFVFILIGGFITETLLARRTLQLTSELYKTKRKKVIGKLFTSAESLLILSGIILFIIGFLGWRFIPNSYYLILAILSLMSICVFLMVAGILLVLASLFLLLSRLFLLLWRYIGKNIWKQRKSYITLALKQMSVYGDEYKRTIFAMTLICLCVSPGLILVKSLNNHLEMESNLKVGFSDILVQSWADNNTILMENISTLSGVEKITKVDVIELRELGTVRASNDKTFEVNILNINNVSEFIGIISAKIPDSCGYTLSDISALDTNMTYMMSSKYSRKNNYNKGEIYSSSEITSSSYASYNMTFINDFDCFPLLPYKLPNFLDRFLIEKYNLVMSNLTYSQLKYKFNELTSVNNNTYILVKTVPHYNISLLIEEIENLPYILRVSIYKDELNALKSELNNFSINFLIIITIISLLLLIFYGFLAARNIYKQRTRIIESDYNIGAKKHQIWLNFSIEIILISIIPLLISILISAILLHNLYDYLFDIPQVYKRFVPWLPIWFMVLIILLCLVCFISGWLLEMWNQFHKYKPVRQE